MTIRASVFSGWEINRSWIDRSHGFAIPIKTVLHISASVIYMLNISMCMCLSALYCDILQLTSTFPCHSLDRYSLQHCTSVIDPHCCD